MNEISIMVLMDGFILTLIFFLKKRIDGFNSQLISSVDCLPCLSLYKERIKLSLVCRFFEGKIL